MRALLAILILVMAGCTQPPETSDPPSLVCNQTLDPPRGAGLDNAWDWMELIVYEGDELRPRHPQHPEHGCTANWLEDALAVDGWAVGRSDFTGAEYLELTSSSATSWRDSCTEADRAQVPEFEFTNLWARREGGAKSLMLAAHWDAKEDASGGGVVPAANDGASGMGIILALQRHIAANDIELPFDLIVAFFDAEDGFEDCHPLAGSIHFAQTMPTPVDRMVLLDMVGDSDARFPRESSSVKADPDLVDLVWQKAEFHGLGDNFVDTRKPVTDDHLPFIEVGVPAIDIIDYARTDTSFGFPPYWHTADDTPDQLDPEFMESIAALLLDVLQDPELVDNWP